MRFLLVGALKSYADGVKHMHVAVGYSTMCLFSKSSPKNLYKINYR